MFSCVRYTVVKPCSNRLCFVSQRTQSSHRKVQEQQVKISSRPLTQEMLSFRAYKKKHCESLKTYSQSSYVRAIAKDEKEIQDAFKDYCRIGYETYKRKLYGENPRLAFPSYEDSAEPDLEVKRILREFRKAAEKQKIMLRQYLENRQQQETIWGRGQGHRRKPEDLVFRPTAWNIKA